MIPNGRCATFVPLVLIGAAVAAGCGSADDRAAALSSVAAAQMSTPPAPSPTAEPTGPAETSSPAPRPTTAAPRAEPRPAPATRASTTSPPRAVTPTAPATGSSTESAVLRLTNDARAKAGCAALNVDRRLTKAAQGHSDDMAERSYFAHDSPDGTTFADRIEAAGHPSPGGENIARGQRSAAEVVQAWLDSPGHRANIENCSFATIGVGFTADGYYWVQDFGR